MTGDTGQHPRHGDDGHGSLGVPKQTPEATDPDPGPAQRPGCGQDPPRHCFGATDIQYCDSTSFLMKAARNKNINHKPGIQPSDPKPRSKVKAAARRSDESPKAREAEKNISTTVDF